MFNPTVGSIIRALAVMACLGSLLGWQFTIGQTAKSAAQDRFWEMHALLFHRQKALEDDDLRRYAGQAGLDVARFDRDRTDRAVMERIRRDVVSGLATGEVRGTPTLFVDGVVHAGGYDAASLAEAVGG